jgi:hypothetical protein
LGTNGIGEARIVRIESINLHQDCELTCHQA